MSYTVTQLITNAFYLSQVVSRELQTVTGQELSDGLTWLNALLSLKSANTRLIPYYQQYQFTAVIGQEEYFVPNLVQPETLTFNIGPVRYSTMPQSRRPYFGASRVDNITSLPFNWHFERTLGGSNIFLYFVPDQQYPVKIWGKFGFTDVALNQDLELTYEQYYIDYLRYRLAKRICSEYGIMFQPQAEKELEELEDLMVDVSPPDMTIGKISSLQGSTGINWGDINIGRGWRPGN
jgi:hypothetical protein